MAGSLKTMKRGARVEMRKRNMNVELPKICAVCCDDMERSEWLRCNTCLDINICVSCTSADRRHPCLDKHTFTVMFRIHELSLRNLTKHDRVLEKVMEEQRYHICDKCEQRVNLRSWVRCNDCSDFDLCMTCWGKAYHEHCLAAGTTHTFTNMTQLYRIKVAPTCAFLSDEDQTLALFQHVGININEISLNPQYDRAYCSAKCKQAGKLRMHSSWTGNWHGAKAKIIPYYCPIGWRRFSVVAKDVDFENSVTVYHGTRPSLIEKICKNGLLCRKCQHEVSAAYVSPSIMYCAHPRYARIVEMRFMGTDQVVYAQFVMELRVNLSVLETWSKRETLSAGSAETIDPNFPENNGLELLLRKEPSGSYVSGEDGVHVTGVMVRVIDHDPFDDAEAWWWTKWQSKDAIVKHKMIFEPGVDECNEVYGTNEWDYW